MLRKHIATNRFHVTLDSHVKRRESITILPEEIILNIFILLPAEILFNVLRYVCRQWYTIIEDPRFVDTHYLLSTSTILWRTSNDVGIYHVLDAREECYSKVPGFIFRCYPERVTATCNGLLLIRNKPQQRYYIGNPITRRILTLPKFPSFMNPCICSLAFEASSKLYKAMVVFIDKRRIITSIHDERYGCAIMAVGVDEAWRALNITHLEEVYRGYAVLGDHYFIPGFVYFIAGYNRHIFVLDVASENMKIIEAPFNPYSWFLPNGNSISFVCANEDFSMEVWVLKDHKTEEWVKVSHIEGELARPISEDNKPGLPLWRKLPLPIMWLQYGEKILFCSARSIEHDLSSNGSMNSPNSCVPSGHFYVYDLNIRAFSEFEKNNDKYSVFFSLYEELSLGLKLSVWLAF